MREHFWLTVSETFFGGWGLMLTVGALHHEFGFPHPTIGYWHAVALVFFIGLATGHRHHHSWEKTK